MSFFSIRPCDTGFGGGRLGGGGLEVEPRFVDPATEKTVVGTVYCPGGPLGFTAFDFPAAESELDVIAGTKRARQSKK